MKFNQILEREVEEYLVTQTKKRFRGALPLKLEAVNFKGAPDRLMFLPDGVFCLVEVKRPGGKLRKLQEYRKKQLEALGYEVYTVDTKNAVDDLLNVLEAKERRT